MLLPGAPCNTSPRRNFAQRPSNNSCENSLSVAAAAVTAAAMAVVLAASVVALAAVEVAATAAVMVAEAAVAARAPRRSR